MKLQIVLILKVFVTQFASMARLKSLLVAELFEMLHDRIKIIKLTHFVLFADF